MVPVFRAQDRRSEAEADEEGEEPAESRQEAQAPAKFPNISKRWAKHRLKAFAVRQPSGLIVSSCLICFASV